MATALFHVTVGTIAGNDVVFQLRIITGEQPDFYTGRAFALMLLYDPIVKQNISDAPLARHVSAQHITDVAWLHEHVDEYIDEAVLTTVDNHPVTADLERMSPKQRREFFQSNQAPTGTFEITVTNPEWKAHLRPGMEWESAAYDAFV
jgi:hypothetical protein